jgi:hypothetical protein
MYDLSFKEAARRMRRDFHVKISPSAICKWTLGQFPARQTPSSQRGELNFSSVLCIDEVFVSVGGRKVAVLIAVDPMAEIVLHFVLESSDTEGVRAALLRLKELGANPDVFRQRP